MPTRLTSAHRSTLSNVPGDSRNRRADSPARQERRRERRASLDVFANRFLEGHRYLCCATDISRQGMQIRRLSEPERPPARFSGIEFQLPGCPDVLTARGEIVFENPGARTLGIRFTHLSRAVAGAIDRYLEQRQQR
jgi:hypothetical protein